MPDRNEFIKKHKGQFIRLALAGIESAQSFQSKGVPVSFLKPVRMTVTKQDQLEILFELKAI